jgi:O-antigen/teichoic acid export membrane protein
MLRSDFVRKLMSNSVAQGLNFGSRWLLNLALARHLLEQEFGVFSFIYMLANLFFPAIAFGANFYLIHHAAQQRHISQLLQSLRISLLVFVALTLGCGALLWWLEAGLSWTLYLLSLLIGLSWAVNQACFSYLKGAQQFALEVRSQLLSVGLTLMLVVTIFAGVFNQTSTVLLWVLFISLFPLLTALRALWPEYLHWRRQPLNLGPGLLQQLKQRFSYAWHDVFAIYLTNIPFVFLALFSSLLALGQFRKAFVLFMPVTLLPVVFSQVLLAKLSHQALLSDKLHLFKRVFLFSFPLLSVPYLVLLLACPWLYPWLLAEPLTAQAQLICTLVVLTLWLTLLKTYFEVLITALGLNKWRAVSVTVVALIGSAAYLVAYRQLSAEVAAWIFFATNSLAVLSLMALSWPAVRHYQRRHVKSAG